MKFELDTTDGRARRGRLVFDRGVVETPCFMPVGTYGTVKGMTPEEVEATGAQIILGNTFPPVAAPGPGNHETARRSARFYAVEGADPHRLRRLPGLQPWRYS
ncbi:tRNA-guanine transglycosylase [Escherichia coli]